MFLMNRLSAAVRDLRELFNLPQLTINLMYEDTKDNDPFYGKIVKDFYKDSLSWHPKYPFLAKFRHGVATCVLPTSFDAYFMKIEASARRNYKKESRCGYIFSKIQFNDYLEDIGAIRSSAEYRQGKMSEEWLRQPPRPVANPPSQTDVHDYSYFGVLREGRLYSYAGCFIAGEMCHLEQIFGHERFQPDGIVPMLIISIANYLYTTHPHVKYYIYGSYFGAGETMRRFKRKFGFLPHRVTWVLKSPCTTSTTSRELPLTVNEKLTEKTLFSLEGEGQGGR